MTSKVICLDMIRVICFYFLISGTNTSSCKDKFQVFPGHSACGNRSSTAKPGNIDSSVAVAAHNTFRVKAAKELKGTNLLEMRWDQEVAMVAQKWTEECYTGHDGNFQRIIPGKFTLGQNILTSEKALTWDEVVGVWYNEVENFVYGSNQVPLSKIGHFTQLTWADSYLVGCGYTVCGPSTHFYVCNYAPSGNHRNALGRPFLRENFACKKRLESGLCDCGGTACYSNGFLNQSTCSCKCPRDLTQSEDNCEVHCNKWKDPGFCRSSYSLARCLQWSNVPFECPLMCKLCPYVDKTYVEGSRPVEQLTAGKSSSPANSLKAPAAGMWLIAITEMFRIFLY